MKKMLLQCFVIYSIFVCPPEYKAYRAYISMLDAHVIFPTKHYFMSGNLAGLASATPAQTMTNSVALTYSMDVLRLIGLGWIVFGMVSAGAKKLFRA